MQRSKYRTSRPDSGGSRPPPGHAAVTESVSRDKSTNTTLENAGSDKVLGRSEGRDATPPRFVRALAFTPGPYRHPGRSQRTGGALLASFRTRGPGGRPRLSGRGSRRPPVDTDAHPWAYRAMITNQ